jgi:hypothetical protein
MDEGGRMKPLRQDVAPGAALDQWIVMPVVECLDYTIQAIDDCLAQTGLPKPPRVLLIDNGSEKETRNTLEVLQVQHKQRLLCLFHHPPLGGPPFGTLNASWNAGLDFCWRAGAEEVLVVNNDVRLHEQTFATLLQVLRHGNLFVSAVGVTEEQWPTDPKEWTLSHGGPDFSCFIISHDCHQTYRFDPRFTYFGDNDYHRQLTLGGDADRIFSVNVPYLHYGSKTINRTEETAEAYHKVFEDHRERYKEKWGGLVGEETKPDAPH